MSAYLPLAIFNIQPAEMLLIGVVLLLLFGPRLPTVMRSLGKGITEFKKGIHDTEEHIRRELDKPPEPDHQIAHQAVEQHPAPAPQPTVDAAHAQQPVASAQQPASDGQWNKPA